MKNPIIAALTAMTLALTPAAPVAAQQFDQEAVGKLLFGLIAALAVGKIVQNASDDGRTAEAPPAAIRHPSQGHDRGGIRSFQPPVVRQTPGGLATPGRLPPIEAPVVVAPPGGRGGWLSQTPRGPAAKGALPARCIRSVSGPRGPERLLGIRCLDNRTRISSTLPAICFRQIQGRKVIRRGFNPDCLRGAGYRFD